MLYLAVRCCANHACRPVADRLSFSVANRPIQSRLRLSVPQGIRGAQALQVAHGALQRHHHSRIVTCFPPYLEPSHDLQQVLLAVERVVVRRCTGRDRAAHRLVAAEGVFQHSLAPPARRQLLLPLVDPSRWHFTLQQPRRPPHGWRRCLPGSRGGSDASARRRWWRPAAADPDFCHYVNYIWSCDGGAANPGRCERASLGRVEPVQQPLACLAFDELRKAHVQPPAGEVQVLCEARRLVERDSGRDPGHASTVRVTPSTTTSARFINLLEGIPNLRCLTGRIRSAIVAAQHPALIPG